MQAVLPKQVVHKLREETQQRSRYEPDCALDIVLGFAIVRFPFRILNLSACLLGLFVIGYQMVRPLPDSLSMWSSVVVGILIFIWGAYHLLVGTSEN